MDERKDNSWLEIVSRAADFVFGGLMILIGGYFLAIPLIKPGGNDIVMTMAIGAIPIIFGISLIFRRRVKPPAR
jgi:uncharacterized membrane protein HdeD (DUF308 family)